MPLIAAEPMRGHHVARAQAGAGGGAAARHALDERARGAGAQVRRADAEVGVAHGLSGLELAQLRAHEVDRNGEADARARLRGAVGGDLVDDADDPAARVEHGAAGVAGVERRVGLDRVRDGEAVGGADRPVQAGDHARAQAAIVGERVADGRDLIADRERRGTAERQRVQGQARRIDREDGDVGGLVGAEDLGRASRPVLELHADRGGAFDDVGGGDDVALAVDDEPGAGRGRGLVRTAERRGAAAGGRDAARGDVDDARGWRWRTACARRGRRRRLRRRSAAPRRRSSPRSRSWSWWSCRRRRR